MTPIPCSTVPRGQEQGSWVEVKRGNRSEPNSNKAFQHCYINSGTRPSKKQGPIKTNNLITNSLQSADRVSFQSYFYAKVQVFQSCCVNRGRLTSPADITDAFIFNLAEKQGFSYNLIVLLTFIGGRF